MNPVGVDDVTVQLEAKYEEDDYLDDIGVMHSYFSGDYGLSCSQ
jgi:hypothetical protein